ncbi:hypothetical protein DS901_00880 [Loktanella sp. D2R18]|uniref:hypothetical protein n=1 Tax=Loktanella sp. D2R18 TaxID=2267230 RepID=UPI000DE8478C|nr:hypothetical protein [Loktanella sp. D2R18]MDO6591351.1 hypothetical protein [Yoonia sp. 1_MG-2023]RBW46298.1 hypothetical protein DS901_00880 [Loktanella sp. D2R18]
MYIRFVRQNIVDGIAAREGFFCAAYELRDTVGVDQHTFTYLNTLLGWFYHNLQTPDRFNRSTSKGNYRRNAMGLSWFKPDAKDMIAKAFELVALLEENGHRIEIIKSHRIGYIVFEDQHQVVAEPFADTPR